MQQVYSPSKVLSQKATPAYLTFPFQLETHFHFKLEA